MKSDDDYSSLVHSIGTEAYIESDNPNSAYMVYIVGSYVHSRVRIIRIK